MKVKSVLFIDPVILLGKSLKVYLKDRANDNAAFYFKCTEAGLTHISGYDENSVNLRIELVDIEFVMGV